jgi:hypothetical protein
MAIVVAVKKAGMAASTARTYYARYLYDPNREIPVPHTRSSHLNCTKKQVRDVVGYLVNDNMSLATASAKAKMSIYNASEYYDAYLNDPERRIPNVKPRSGKHYSQNQIQKAIRYIVDDKLYTICRNKFKNGSTNSQKSLFGLLERPHCDKVRKKRSLIIIIIKNLLVFFYVNSLNCDGLSSTYAPKSMRPPFLNSLIVKEKTCLNKIL